MIGSFCPSAKDTQKLMVPAPLSCVSFLGRRLRILAFLASMLSGRQGIRSCSVLLSLMFVICFDDTILRLFSSFV